MLFGSINHKNKTQSTFSYILDKKPFKFIKIYAFLAIIGGLLGDVIFGRGIADLWHYPNLYGPLDYLLPIFIYYPFGGLQVYEIYQFTKEHVKKKFNGDKIFMIDKRTKSTIMKAMLLISVAGFLIPIINWAFNSNKHSNEAVMISIAMTIFAGDALVYWKKKESILLDAIQGNKQVLITMLFSWIIALALTEIPNTFSWEWIYTPPFTGIEIFKINILILTIGWFSLVFLTVRAIDIANYMIGK